VLGAEAKATGHNIFLGPAVDIARAPHGGRTFESFGEDPLLQSRLVAAEVAAVQAHGVLACVKHFLANNQEYRRSTTDVVVDERTPQEIYLPPFAAALGKGRAAAVMGSYNRLNGVYACENHTLLNGILREQWGFRGFVMSDFLANPSTTQSAEAGLDWELGAKMWGPKLLEAANTGSIAMDTIDGMVRRILRPVVGLGLADHPRQVRAIAAQEHSAEALAIAEQAIVLLKNEGDLLPLHAGDLRSLAVIGPDADNVSAAGGGSGYVQPTHAVSVLDGIRQRVGSGVRVEYAPGVDPIGAGALLPGPAAIPSVFFTPPGDELAGSGLLAEYWDNPDFAGEPATTRVEPQPELNFGFFDLHPGMNAASPKLPPKPFAGRNPISVRWSGLLTAPAGGEYEFALTCLGTARLRLDGELLIDSNMPAAAEAEPPRLPLGLPPRTKPAAIRTVPAKARLEAGRAYTFVAEYAAGAPGTWIFGEAMVRVGWRAPADAINPLIAHAADLAGRCDAAVVVVRTYETEEMDRPSLRLPNDQDELIHAVATANSRTVVVLMNAGPVEVASWETGVPAIVEAWYAGQEQGNAVARVLFGDVNPCGKLPITFPRSESETPVAKPEQYPGVDGAVHYSEGVYIGYRGYDRLRIQPQYPFGHGLSYTSFRYSNLRIDPRADGTDVIDVSFDLENPGGREGTEVAQIYLSAPAWGSVKRLAGWARMHLTPGEVRMVTVTLDPHSDEHPLSTWNREAREWRMGNGEYQLYVGASSRDVRLVGQFHL
jgi:beta-glucosidase